MWANKFSDQYDHKALIKYLGMIFSMVALYKVTGGYGAFVIPLLVMVSLAKRQPIEVLFWVVFMTISSAGNRVIFGGSPVAMLVTRGTLVLLTFVVASKVFNSRSSLVAMPFWGITGNENHGHR